MREGREDFFFYETCQEGRLIAHMRWSTAYQLLVAACFVKGIEGIAMANTDHVSTDASQCSVSIGTLGTVTLRMSDSELRNGCCIAIKNVLLAAKQRPQWFLGESGDSCTLPSLSRVSKTKRTCQA